jgi:hypothetical protein
MDPVPTPGRGIRRTWSERGAAGVRIKRERNEQRGPGTRVSPQELRDYIEGVIDHPGDAIDEMEYAYWIEGLAFSRPTWLARWNEVARTHGSEDTVYGDQA